MRKNILLVDDDKHIQELVTFFLEQAGFVVRTSADGFTAIEELQTRHFDLIILDIFMPHMNGFQTLNAIRANSKVKGIPILMLTGDGSKRNIERVASEGVTEFVVKPPTRDDLVGRIERMLGGKPQYQEIKMQNGDPNSRGFFQFQFTLKSISINGVILESPLALPKDYRLENCQLAIFFQLGIQSQNFKVVDCSQNDDGSFSHFISFIDMRSEDQDTLREWLVTRTLQLRNSGQKAS